MATKTKDPKAQIIKKYMTMVLEEGDPASPYAFAKAAKISESEFYEHFGSFEHLDSHIFASFFRHTLDVLDKSDEYISFDAENKLLTLYYTFFEVLKVNRSFVLNRIGKEKNKLPFSQSLTLLRSDFKKYIEHLGIEKLDIKSENLNKLQDRSIQEVLWHQLLITLKFWMEDVSPNFEKTDLFIEKSITTGFELLNVAPAKRLVDLGKFLFKEKMTL